MPGTITGVLSRHYTPQGRPQLAKLVLTCTADSGGNHDYPVTTVNSLAGLVGFSLNGLKLYSIVQKPGTTGSTDQADITITDEYGIDLMGGNGTNFIRNSVPGRYVVDPALAPIIMGDLIITITNNSVASAVLTLVLELIGI
jgi:hypothetical protein